LALVHIPETSPLLMKTVLHYRFQIDKQVVRVLQFQVLVIG